jgi:hypothetical protein
MFEGSPSIDDGPEITLSAHRLDTGGPPEVKGYEFKGIKTFIGHIVEGSASLSSKDTIFAPPLQTSLRDT